jgi:hypothetical protein
MRILIPMMIFFALFMWALGRDGRETNQRQNPTDGIFQRADKVLKEASR